MHFRGRSARQELHALPRAGGLQRLAHCDWVDAGVHLTGTSVFCHIYVASLQLVVCVVTKRRDG